MKKFITIVLVGAMLLSASACGSSSQSSKPAESSAAGGTQASEAKSEKKTDWPKKPIQVVVPYKPGGDTDFNARVYTTKLNEILGQNVVVTNVDGNAGAVGATQAKNSANDGYTALFFHSAVFVNHAAGNADFGLEEFELACVGAKHAGSAVVVNAKSPYKTLQDLIKASKENPNKLSFAANTGGTTYVMGSMLNMAGAKLNLVDLGGTSERVAALLGGHVDAIPNSLGSVKQYMDAGDFRALALLEDERNSVYADIPTAVEQGYTDASFPIYYFFAFPKGTPEDIVAKFADACEEISKTEAYQKEIMDAYQQDPFFVKGEEAQKLMEKQKAMVDGMKDLLK